ncbi:hypothetical protein [Pacificoceanicola onchidii]|uniref:hypothetical protein n=1 Tax=Pacificoceanicola onchidii TaxID=2562685 RepID=UPI0014562018|nr:hypothetical protein [Pacificoceanicola onchidii]
MKTTLLALAGLASATPALAHADGSFHSHGAEAFLVLAAAAAVGVWFHFSNK